jgi:copper(I)-binding protein
LVGGGDGPSMSLYAFKRLASGTDLMEIKNQLIFIKTVEATLRFSVGSEVDLQLQVTGKFDSHQRFC